MPLGSHLASDVRLECLVIIRTGGETTIHKTHNLDVAAKTELFIGGTEDGLVKDILDALLGEREARDKVVIAA